MVTGHFGLDEGPFHGKAEGQEVFVGPEQAPVVARLRKMLASSDAVVAVTGPVGVGKTTLARHALAGISGRKIVIQIDRMRLAPDEVLELLLARFDVSRQPKGTIQRFAAFRRLLQERVAGDTRVFIVVEDAERIGVDALLELETLTSTDSGDSAGASIVLMGSDELPAFLTRPALVRLRQRIRLQQAVAAFTAADVTAYMRHCLEAAGGVLEQIFEAGTPEIVWRYSGGVARVVDNLCESALEAAAETGLATILPEFLQQVAGSCGLEPLLPAAAAGAAGDTNRPVHRGEIPTEITTDRATAPAPAAEPRDAPAAAARQAAAEAPPPETPPADTDRVGASQIDEILPALIERLQASAVERADAAPFDAGDGAATAADADEIPTLSDSMRIAERPAAKDATRPPAESAPSTPLSLVAESVPEHGGERVDESCQPAALTDGAQQAPTEIETVTAAQALAIADDTAADTPDAAHEESHDEFPDESRCEIAEEIADAEATADALTWSPADEDDSGPADAAFGSLDDQRALEPDAVTDVFVTDGESGPELDALQAAIHAANAWQAGDPGAAAEAAAARQEDADAELPEITLDRALAVPEPAANDPGRWAEELSKAKSLEDISDMLAETLFGSEEMQSVSAEISAGRQATRPAAAKVDKPAPAPPQKSKAKPQAVPAAKPAAVAAMRPRAPAAQKAPQAAAMPGATSAATSARNKPPEAGKAGSMTMSQRIDMLNSLNKGKPAMPRRAPRMAEIVLAETPDTPARATGPETIESQIDTAITQTRQALGKADLARLAAEDDDPDDHDDKGSRGLFGLFRRSSKH